MEPMNCAMTDACNDQLTPAFPGTLCSRGESADLAYNPSVQSSWLSRGSCHLEGRCVSLWSTRDSTVHLHVLGAPPATGPLDILQSWALSKTRPEAFCSHPKSVTLQPCLGGFSDVWPIKQIPPIIFHMQHAALLLFNNAFGSGGLSLEKFEGLAPIRKQAHKLVQDSRLISAPNPEQVRVSGGGLSGQGTSCCHLSLQHREPRLRTVSWPLPGSS